MEFSYDGKLIILEKDENENIDIFIERGYFIIRNINKTNFNNLIKFSYIYVNNKYYNCIYNKTLLEKLKTLI